MRWVYRSGDTECREVYLPYELVVDILRLDSLPRDDFFMDDDTTNMVESCLHRSSRNQTSRTKRRVRTMAGRGGWTREKARQTRYSMVEESALLSSLVENISNWLEANQKLSEQEYIAAVYVAREEAIRADTLRAGGARKSAAADLGYKFGESVTILCTRGAHKGEEIEGRYVRYYAKSGEIMVVTENGRSFRGEVLEKE